MTGRRLAAVATVVAALAGTASAEGATIRVQGTTDTVDAGLIDGITYPGQPHVPGLKELYEAKYPGDTLEYVGVGTGAALTNARKGLADLVVTHAPSLEKRFVDDGYVLGQGKQIFYSDYVIVGPKTADPATNDPAGVATAARHDAVGAFEAIAIAGKSGKATFLSRNNASGTNVQEQVIWGQTDPAVVATKFADNAEGDTARKTPDPAPNPWYRTNAVGQAQNVKDTSACVTSSEYPNGGCYTMTDRGTYNNLVNAGTITNLQIVADVNDAGARGGPDLLTNPFGGYVLNPNASYPPNTPAKNVEGAQRLLDYIVSPEFQSYLSSFPNAVDPAFRPDAFPNVTVDGGLPQTATSGSRLAVAGTVSNRVPGGGLAAGSQPTLQASTDNGASWTDVGQAAATGADGRFSVSGTVGITAAYRLSLPASPATSYNFFTPTTVPLGTVTATPVAGGGTPTKPADKTKPRVSKVRLTRRSLRVRISEAGIVKVTVQRRTVKRVRRNGKVRRVVRYRTVRRVTIRTTRARTVTRKIKRLPAGRYRIAIRARDRAGNLRKLTATKRVKAAR